MERDVLNLRECSELRLTLLQRPPLPIHATLVVLAVLLAAAVSWAALTQADLVVRAPARVRPGDGLERGFGAVSGDKISVLTTGRVAETYVQLGAEVRRGQPLFCLETDRVQNEIRKRRESRDAVDKELQGLAKQREALDERARLAVAKAEAELAETDTALANARRRQASDIRLAEAELALALDEHRRAAQTLRDKAAAPAEVVAASVKLRVAEEKECRARLPIEEGKLDVARKELAGVRAEYELRRQELEARIAAKHAEAAAIWHERANLELEERQARYHAPIDGVVTMCDVRTGELVQAGKLVMAVARPDQPRVDVAVSGKDIGLIRPDMVARIKIDTFDYQQYGSLQGVVEFIAPDADVLESGDGQRVQGYVVRVRLAATELSRGDYRGRVRVGMAGRADIITGSESVLSLLLKRIRQRFSLG